MNCWWLISTSYTKDLYQLYETLKKLHEFTTVWEDQEVFGSTKNFWNFAKVSCLWSFFHVFMGKTMHSNRGYRTEFGIVQNLQISSIWVDYYTLCVRTLMFLVLDTNLCYMYYITYIHICSAKYIHTLYVYSFANIRS